ncbi:MAG TPA: DUF86 domain-containing protein [Leptospiraceae bacterium]|nr:DUF86 domain-containing protein [Leptospiraceae bacterium]HMX33740.1 DUF86 domain-containing protein [Leptospiraceae bacterium]HMY33211.1 DUF86 domain-containing protein [Leptospiraceae bacterium]HMZ65081.1 DUF86 domain-containing protein [Leptospiraceae bacterium]HNA08771.1 DUF86 domain-containing protein [Leptospiraceae bacterium]
MQKNDLSHVMDIFNACNNIIAFSKGISHEEFEEDIKTQSAILHQFMIMGEATKRLTEEFKSEHNSIPWRKIAGFRDILIHQYDNIIPDEVWRIIETSVPDLARDLATLLIS